MRLTEHYQLTKALHRHQYGRVHPCPYIIDGRCDMVRLDDHEFVRYNPQIVLNMWSQFSHHTCPAHLSELHGDLETRTR